MFYEYKGCKPVVDNTAFVHPQATVIGSVVIGKNVYIGPQCVLRGDFGQIEIHDGCNVQECCVIHMFPGTKVILKQNAHIGHGAVIHGAIIGENAMIGMNAVVMDNVQVGKNSIVGALTFIKANEIIPENSLVVGNPGKVVKEVSEDMINWKTKGTEIYQQLAIDAHLEMVECLPLSSKIEQKPIPIVDFKTWKK